MRKLTAMLAALVLLAGCGGAETTDTPATVRLLVFGAPEELQAYRTLVDAYAKAANGARVELVEASDRADLITRLSTSIAGGSPPDVFLMNYRFYGQFAAKNAVEPLDDRLAKSTVVKLADLYPQVTEAFQWQGRQLCLPQNVSSLAVYYNRTMFAKHGIAEPKAGWTWNDLITTATALTRNASGAIVRGTEAEGGSAKVAVYGLGVEPTLIRVAPLVWSAGGQIVDDEREPTRFTFDAAPARDALRDFVALRLAYGVVPTDEEVEAEDDETRFSNGRLAMLLSSRRVTTTFRTIKDFEWDVAPMPMYGKQQAGILHSDAYCMTSGSKAKDAAWRFMEYAIGPEGQRIIAATGRTVPSNMAVSRSPAFLDPAQPPRNAQVFLDAVPTIRRVPTISTWPEIEDVAEGILENALYRGDRLDDVIRQLDEQTRPIFARGVAP
ncbi:ABC transporter substrate-binding protein [Phytohabitans houttuyneae]|uniref:ABC transporter substrate-binding protein n=1 Tax=Phytohabitans houttuyneae TaxID=1076126 RepID=A0A6V8KBN0_9ACTN|nr:sugar ABC transporter substrate-binding protein [Phytohabitans houttuyneae]GFJ80830.1 ABC transporter substrate-binding protein [Phytohabitans houttuyneae]